MQCGQVALQYMYIYHSLQIKRPPHFVQYFDSIVFSNIQLVMTICPNKCVEEVKSHNNLAVAIQRNSSNGHAPRESSQVCWYFLQKNGKLTSSVETEGKLGASEMCLCLRLQGETKTADYVKLKAYFKPVLQKDSRTTLYNK